MDGVKLTQIVWQQWEDQSINTTSGSFDIGTYRYFGGGGFFNGALDELRVYDRALSPDEIRQLSVVPLPGAALLGAIGLAYSGWRLRGWTAWRVRGGLRHGDEDLVGG